MDETSAPQGESAEHVRQLVERLSTLLEITRQLAAEINADALLALIVAKTTALLDAERSTLYLVDNERHELWSKIAEQAEIPEIRLPIDGPGLATYVARSGETVNITDAYRNHRFNPEMDRRTGFNTRNMLVMPMRNRVGVITGVVQVMNKRDGVFGRDDEELLSALAASAAIAIENAQIWAAQKRSFDQLKQQYEALRIEVDETKKARQVAAVTETEYFRDLLERATQLRAARQRS